MDYLGGILRPAGAKVLQPISIEPQLVAVLDHGGPPFGSGVQHEHPHHVQEQLVIARRWYPRTARHHLQRSSSARWAGSSTGSLHLAVAFPAWQRSPSLGAIVVAELFPGRCRPQLVGVRGPATRLQV